MYVRMSSEKLTRSVNVFSRVNQIYMRTFRENLCSSYTVRIYILFSVYLVLNHCCFGQAQTCVLPQFATQIGGYQGDWSDPFYSSNNSGTFIAEDVDTSVWVLWPGEFVTCMANAPVVLLETVSPYPPSFNDTLHLTYAGNPFPIQYLVERLAEANSNEIQSIEDPVLTGHEKFLLVSGTEIFVMI